MVEDTLDFLITLEQAHSGPALSIGRDELEGEIASGLQNYIERWLARSYRDFTMATLPHPQPRQLHCIGHSEPAER